MTHPAFELLREHFVPSLKVTVQEYKHTRTGAQHIHLQADSDENVFLVALRTVPKDSTGVAHILEHTALCGSKKYPVRDPFFMMTRRSLNTFMNAFTSSDWTAYPFASCNKKDFDNLLTVYLDAVFFSRLDPLDFAQEGHRLDFSETGNPDSELVYKGVVYNEMKGAMSSVNAQLWQALTRYLFPTSTYHFNSGGEPSAIPQLSYEQLVHFYRTHYHPSNATFMTFGDISAQAHQEKFETLALAEFDALDEQIQVDDEQRYAAPLRVQEYYPNNEDDLSRKSHVVLGWLLGHSIDLAEALRAQLLSAVLLDHSACPLMLALESSDLGNAPSPLCGLDDSQKEMSFVCGLAGTEAKASDDVETLILDTLKRVAEEGIPQSEIDAALHQLELNQREIGGDSYPYGLQLILKSLSSATHRGDPVALLDLDEAINTLREDAQKPDFIPSLIQRLLLDNPHRVTLTLRPDAQMAERQDALEKARLSRIKDTLDDEATAKIIDMNNALTARQEMQDPPGALPKVTLEDVPEQERAVEPKTQHLGKTRLSTYEAGTNGLLYQQVIFDLPALSDEDLAILNFYGTCVGELGAGEESYLEIQQKQNRVSGGINAFQSLRGGVDDPNKGQGYFVYSSKALVSNQVALNSLMQAMINEARFDEYSRIKELLTQVRVGMENSVTGNGHALAMNAAAASLSSPAFLQHQFSGLEAIRRVKALDKATADNDALIEFATSLQALHGTLTNQQSQLLLIAEQEHLDAAARNLSPLCHNYDNHSTFELARSLPTQENQAWICNTQINFCASAFPTVPMGHEDSAALVVLANFLRNGFLHKRIREQGGAYGGGAVQDNNSATFRFYSYRDPRMGKTLEDFGRSAEWIKSTKNVDEQLEEAILGVIGSLDRSESPAGRAKRCFYSDLHGRDLAKREAYRKRVLSTRHEDLIRVAERYLAPELASEAVVTGEAGVAEAESLGFALHRL